MGTLSTDLTRIKTAVDRIRVKTNTAGDVIEDVATATEALKNPTGNINITNTNSVNVADYATAQVVDANLTAGNIKKDVTVLGITGTHEGGTKSNIYKVSTIAERDLIDDMVEGDMCVVITKSEIGVVADIEFQIIKFPSTVVLDSAITASGSARDTASTLNLSWSPTAFGCLYFGSSVINVNYTSSDGITYTRTDSFGNSIDFGSKLTIPNNRFNSILSSFMRVDTIEFPGLFTYLSNTWVQTDIGASLVASDIVLNKKAYSNSGILTGTRDMNKYREEFIYIQATEPTDKNGI